MTAQEFYESVKRELAPGEQLRLARLILDELAEPGALALEYSDQWTDDDLRDIAAFSAGSLSESNDDV